MRALRYHAASLTSLPPMTTHAHPALAALRQLGLITATELDEAMDELEILALDEADDVDMPRLAAGADAATALKQLVPPLLGILALALGLSI